MKNTYEEALLFLSRYGWTEKSVKEDEHAIIRIATLCELYAKEVEKCEQPKPENNISEGNKFLCDFMEKEWKQYGTNGVVLNVDGNPIKYHSDWNWLREVVNKIVYLKISESDAPVKAAQKYIQDIPIYYEINVVFNACFTFLKLYCNSLYKNPRQ